MLFGDSKETHELAKKEIFGEEYFPNQNYLDLFEFDWTI